MVLGCADCPSSLNRIRTSPHRTTRRRSCWTCVHEYGLYVLKFRGAAQGTNVLVAEVICGEIGRSLGLTVPELVEIRLDPALGAAEPDSEVRELIERSPGINL